MIIRFDHGKFWLVIGLEDGYDLDTLSEAGAAPRSRGHHDTSGDTCNVTPEIRANPGAVKRVRNATSLAHSKDWKCLQSMLSK